MKYPRTATLEGYSTSPQYDPYGRVCTLITVTAQNGFGNYITEDYYVVLQSCSYSGYYTCDTGGMHYTKNGDYLSFLFTLNGWNEDPSNDNTKEVSYNDALELIENKNYLLAANKLRMLGDYKSSEKLKEACNDIVAAEKYNEAINLFLEEKYVPAREKISSLLKEYSNGYLKAERLLALCNAAISRASGNGNTSDGGNASNDGNTSNSGNTSNGGNTSQQPTSCSHNYANATCTTPKTCTLCSETSGSALGHTYSTATCTEPQTCSCGATTGSAAGHKWTNITQTVHHEEQGHYEDVQDAKKVQKYKCWLCSYAQPTYATKEEYYAHFDSTHGNEPNSSYFRERYEMVEDWVYETVTVWVVDREAYSEMVVTGRKCDVCGKTE